MTLRPIARSLDPDPVITRQQVLALAALYGNGHLYRTLVDEIQPNLRKRIGITFAISTAIAEGLTPDQVADRVMAKIAANDPEGRDGVEETDTVVYCHVKVPVRIRLEEGANGLDAARDALTQFRQLVSDIETVVLVDPDADPLDQYRTVGIQQRPGPVMITDVQHISEIDHPPYDR